MIQAHFNNCRHKTAALNKQQRSVDCVTALGRGMMGKFPLCWKSAAPLAGFLLIIHMTSAKAGPATVPEFDCVIEPQQVVKLASPVVGVIARLDVERGDVIRK